MRAYVIKYMFRTDDPFATKVGLVVDHHKPKSGSENMDCCDQGQGHSEGNFN